MREGFTSLILHNSVTFLRVMAILDRSLYWEDWNYTAGVLATHIENVADGDINHTSISLVVWSVFAY